MTRSGLVGLTVSALLHGVFVAVVLLVASAADRLTPLFIDLTQEDRPVGSEGGRPASPAPARAAAPRRSGGDRAILGGSPAAPASVPEPPTSQPEPPPALPTPSTVASAPALTTAPAVPDVRIAPPTPPVESVTASPSAVTSAAARAGSDAPAGANAPNGAHAPTGTGAPTASPGPGGDRASDSPGGPGAGAARPGSGLAVATPGEGAGDPGAAYAAYLGRLRQRVHEALRYPAAARRRGLTGTVILELTVKPDGAIGRVVVVNSSSHAMLDEAAMESVRGLRPQPFPGDLPSRMLHVRLPVVFELQ